MRCAGVPFCLRSGKRLTRRATEIAVEFKPVPHTPWSHAGAGGDVGRPNLLVVNVSPDHGFVIRVEGKPPGQAIRLQSTALDYCGIHERRAIQALWASRPPDARLHALQWQCDCEQHCRRSSWEA